MANRADIGVDFKSTGSREVVSDAERIAAQIDRLDDKASSLSETYGALEDASTRLATASAAIWGPAILSTQKYIDTVGRGTKISREWMAANDRIQRAQLELGEESTKALLPFFELLADIVEKINEIDPALLEAGIQVGGVLAIAGAVGLLTSQVGNFVKATVELRVALQRAAQRGVRGTGVARGAIAAGTYATALAASIPVGVQAARFAGRIAGNENAANQTVEGLMETLGQGVVIFVNLLARLRATIEKFFIDFFEDLKGAGDEIEEFVARLRRDFGNFVVGLREVLDDLQLAGGLSSSDAQAQREALEEAYQNVLESNQTSRESDPAFTRSRDQLDMLINNWNEYATFIETRQRQITNNSEEYWREFGLTVEQGQQLAQDELNNIFDILSRRTGMERERIEELIELGNLESELREARRQLYIDTSSDLLSAEDQRIKADMRVEDTTLDVAEALGVLGDEAEELLEAFDTDLLDAFAELQAELAEAEADFQASRLEAQEEFERSEKEIEKDNQELRKQQLAAFEKAQARIEANYQKQRERKTQQHGEKITELVASFNERTADERKKFLADEEERLQDWNDARIRAEEDYYRQRDRAIENLDAQALFTMEADFQRQQQRDQQDFDKETRRRQQEFEERQAEAAKEHKKRLAQEQKQFEETLKEDEKNHRDAMAQNKQQFQEQQREQARQNSIRAMERAAQFSREMTQQQQYFQADIAARENNFRTQYAQARQWEQMDTAAKAKYYQEQTQLLSQFLFANAFASVQQAANQVKNVFSNAFPSFAGGGMMRHDGLANLHAGEFVLNRDTTRALSQRLGNNFTQSSVRNMSRTDVGGVNISLPIQGGTGQLSEQQIESAVRRATATLITALQGIGRENNS